MTEKKLPPKTDYSPVADIEKIEATIKKLETIPGFLALTKRQQRIIKATLYLESRAERINDPLSATAVISPQTHVVHGTSISDRETIIPLLKHHGYAPDDRRYAASQDHISDWYCHAAIANLEEENFPGREVATIREGFFTADYAKVPSLEVLSTKIERFGFPCVVHVTSAGETRYRDNIDSQWHSFLALGKDQDGEILVWDKEGYVLPYRIVTLREIYQRYRDDYFYWGLRSLKNRSLSKKLKEVFSRFQ